MKHMPLLRPAMLLLVTIVISACASKPVRLEAFTELVAPSPDVAMIYFYRPKTFTGGGVWHEIRLSERVVGSLANCSFSVVHAPPGEYHLSALPHPSVSMAPPPIKVELKAGQRHFYLLDIDGSFAVFPMAGFVGVYSTIKMGWRETLEQDALPLLSSCTRIEPPIVSGATARDG